MRQVALHIFCFISFLTGCAKEKNSGTEVQQAYAGVTEIIEVKDGKPVINATETMDATFLAMQEAASVCSQNTGSAVTLPDGRKCLPTECAMLISKTISSWGFEMTPRLSTAGGANGKPNAQLRFKMTPPAESSKHALQCVDVSVSAVFYQKSLDAISKRIYEVLKSGSSWDSLSEALSASRESYLTRLKDCIASGANYNNCSRNPVTKNVALAIPSENRGKIDAFMNIFNKKMERYCLAKYSSNDSKCSAARPCRLERIESFASSLPAFDLSLVLSSNGVADRFGAFLCTGNSALCFGVDTSSKGENRAMVQVTIDSGGGSSQKSNPSSEECSTAEEHPLTQEFRAFLESSYKYLN